MYDDERLEELRKRAAAIAEPIWETLLRDIVRRVRGAGGITSTAEYQIYRAEQLGLAEKAIKAALAEQLKISDAAIDMLFEELRDETVRFEENAELRQLVEAYGAVSKKAAAADYEGLWVPGPDGKLYTVTALRSCASGTTGAAVCRCNTGGSRANNMALLTITTPRDSVTQIKNGNGAVTARLQWDPAFGARHTQSFLRTQAFIDSEVLRLMSPYTPIQTSMLIKSATLGTVIGSGKINQIAPYAAWQYYRTDTTRKYDPRRGAYWFERMKADHRTYILKGAAEKAGAKYNE